MGKEKENTKNTETWLTTRKVDSRRCTTEVHHAFYGLSFKYSLMRTWWIHRPLDRSVPWVTTTKPQMWAKSSSSRRWGLRMFIDLKMNLTGNQFIKYIYTCMFCIISVHCFQAQCLSEFSYLWLIVTSYFCITSISCSGTTSQENSWASILCESQRSSRYSMNHDTSHTITIVSRYSMNHDTSHTITIVSRYSGDVIINTLRDNRLMMQNTLRKKWYN